MKKKKNILIIEDDKTFQETWYTKKFGWAYNLFFISSISGFIDYLDTDSLSEMDLIIIDINIEGEDIFCVLREEGLLNKIKSFERKIVVSANLTTARRQNLKKIGIEQCLYKGDLDSQIIDEFVEKRIWENLCSTIDMPIKGVHIKGNQVFRYNTPVKTRLTNIEISILRYMLYESQCSRVTLSELNQHLGRKATIGTHIHNLRKKLAPINVDIETIILPKSYRLFIR